MPRGAAAPARHTRTGGADVQHPKPKTSRRRRASGPAPGGRVHAAEAAAREQATAARAAAPARKPKQASGNAAAGSGATAGNGASARKAGASTGRDAAPARKVGTGRDAAPARKPGFAGRPVVLRPAPAGAPLALRVARAPFVRTLRTRGGGVLDTLLSGQGWIALIGLLLVGIVFFNVGLLELNRNITGTNDRVTTIKRENARLRLDLARLGSSERIQTAAAAEGLVLPAPGDVRYLRVDPTIDARRAAKRIVAPSSVALVAPPTTPDPVLTTPPAEVQPTSPTTPTEATTPAPTAGTTTAEPQAPAPQAGATTTGTPTG